MTATLHDLLKSYREGGVFPSYDQLAAIAGQDQGSAAVRGEAVAESESHPAWSRVILYTDSIRGKQTCRDDLWAITGDELRALLAAKLSARAADAPSEPSERGYPVYLAWNDQINAWVDVGLAEYLAADVQDRRVAYEPQGAAA